MGFQTQLKWSLLAAWIVTIATIVHQHMFILLPPQSQASKTVFFTPSDGRRKSNALGRTITSGNEFTDKRVTTEKRREFAEKAEADVDNNQDRITNGTSSNDNTNKNNNRQTGDKMIREWGCDRTETPLLFVHNGKMGKFCDSKYPHYTMIHDRDLHRQRTYEGSQFCNATTPFGIVIACPHPYKGRKENTHYKSLNCKKCDDDYYLEEDYYFDNVSSEHKSSAPDVGPLPKIRDVFNPDSDPHPGHTCDIVFTSHTNIGSELNWLPPRYLKEHWWDNSVYGCAQKGCHGVNEELEKYWAILLDDRHRRRKQLLQKVGKINRTTRVDSDPTTADEEDTGTRWCPTGYFFKSGAMDVEKVISYDRPATWGSYRAAYKTCGRMLAEKADRVFRKRFYPSYSDHDGKRQKLNFSQFYASMPLHRITLLRDPWSWIISKFFWHQLDELDPDHDGLPCEDLTLPTGYDHRDPSTGRLLGWCEYFSLKSLMKLCGNDCHIRYENKMMSLEEIEDQVESNLRNAFSVVGLLNETESFYDMITDRIDYVNLTYNPEFVGSDHATIKTTENIACKELFGKDENFRESVRQRVPEFAALERIYHVGVEVNRFQQRELQQCRRSKGGTPTKGVYSSSKPSKYSSFKPSKKKAKNNPQTRKGLVFIR
eukprot:jgi/Psemu1/43525/gm1.43525_g